MNIYSEFEKDIKAAIADLTAEGALPSALDVTKLTVEAPRDPSHGDLSTNAAMVLSKQAGMNPRALADILKPAIENIHGVENVEIAGPGFINIRLNGIVYLNLLKQILDDGLNYGQSSMGAKTPVNVEYVSANPTGPLTVGHARGAIVGDSMAALMDKAGYDVRREYYINDAGNQVNVLGESAYLRYREAHGEDITIPDGCYPGEYLKDVGQAAKAQEGDKWLNDDDYLSFFRDFAVNYLMNEIKTDLAQIGIKHNLFYSEKSAVENGSVDRAITALTEKNLMYRGVLEPPKGQKPEGWEEREQVLFKSTDFGDDVDRPIQKSDGTYTYFANDIAHFYDVYQQGYKDLIVVVGADHGGYVRRAESAFKAMTDGEGKFHMPLCAMVNVWDNGKPVKMSKRAGTFITLRDVLDAVGAGVMRFIMLTRQSNQTLEFDYSKALDQSKDNPYFYVQYAHARCCSVLNHAKDMFGDLDLTHVNLDHLNRPETLDVLKVLSAWPKMVEQAASAREPHRIAFYLQDVASALHGLWNMGREDATLKFLIEDNRELSMAHIALISAVKTVIASALNVIGVDPLDELRGDLKDVEDAA
jgi:arginyl-tRNA synthetase